MPLSPEAVATTASRLRAAAEHRRTTPLLSADHPDLTLDDGYAVQAAGVALRVDAGDRVIGMKLGVTSRAKQEAVGIDEPVFGVVLASSVHPTEEPVDLDDYIHPRVEPEIVFRMSSRLAGPGVTVPDVLAATGSIGCGFEIIDSRFEDFRFTIGDVVADNTSAAGVVLGSTWVEPAAIPDLSLVGLLLEVDGDQVATAAGAAILGQPAGAVALLANWLGAQGRAIEPGWLVLSGGMTDAVPLAPANSVVASFGHVGTVGVRTVARIGG